MKYRAEIDGLRAVAVVPVIFFHAGLEAFSGGFVGVDVFFVLSGYLITTIIIDEMDQGRFSLPNFYERRARRILPVLFVVVLCSIPVAWIVMLPGDLRDYSQSLVGVATFSSNILFWRESGYFDTAAELKPMLHTWSLAVEEQFYIFFPLLLMAGWKFGRARILWALAGLFAISLAGAHWGAYNAPSGTFFLLPTRGWELLIGSFVAFHLQRHPVPAATPVTNLLSAAGLGLIFMAIFVYDGQTPFPSLYALAPTLGTALLVLFASPGTYAHALLSRRLLVGVGLISYSAYLWHQPILAFLHQPLTPRFTAIDTPLAIALTFLLAWASWRFVETPTRNRNAMSMKSLATLVLPAWAVIAGAGMFVHFAFYDVREYWMASRPEAVRNMVAIIGKSRPQVSNRSADREGYQNLGDCRFNAQDMTDAVAQRLLDCRAAHGPGIFIIGDSHAIDFFGAVASRFDVPFLAGLTQGGCRPHTILPDCQYDRILAFISEHPDTFGHVLYEQAGFYLLLNPDGEQGDRDMFDTLPLDAPVPAFGINTEHVAGTLDYLARIAAHVPVTWFGPRIEPHITRRMILESGCRHPYTLREGQRAVFERLDTAIIEATATRPSIRFWSQNEIMAFSFPADFMTCEAIYWRDGDHFSAEGEEHFGTRLPEDFLHAD